MVTEIGIGTEKGLYALRSYDGRDWQVDGPHLPGWRVTALGTAPDGRRIAAVGSNWYGVSLHVTDDLKEFEQVGAPSYPEGGPTLNEVWTLRSVGDTVWAGVAEAGLFRSTDLQTWDPVPALNDHPDRADWQPGFGGLCAHHVLHDGGQRLWVGISSVGVWHSEDDGESFTTLDAGVEPTGTPEEGFGAPAFCVHGLAQDPANPDRIWRQEHRGVFRTTDGGRNWERCQQGLPNESGFGFPIVRDDTTGRLFVVPLEADVNRVPVDGRFAVWASDDDGDSWDVAGVGWPEEPTFDQVLRNALATDQAGTLAAGTTAGNVWASTDTGETWARLPGTFPRIGTVAVWST